MSTPWRETKDPGYMRQEKREAGKRGSRRQVNSGRLWFSLRDVIQRTAIGRLLIDCKTGRDGPLKSYRLTDDEWALLKRDANRTPPGCYPALKIELGKFHLLVIEEDMWDETVEALSEIDREVQR